MLRIGRRLFVLLQIGDIEELDGGRIRSREFSNAFHRSFHPRGCDVLSLTCHSYHPPVPNVKNRHGAGSESNSEHRSCRLFERTRSEKGKTGGLLLTFINLVPCGVLLNTRLREESIN